MMIIRIEIKNKIHIRADVRNIYITYTREQEKTNIYERTGVIRMYVHDMRVECIMRKNQHIRENRSNSYVCIRYACRMYNGKKLTNIFWKVIREIINIECIKYIGHRTTCCGFF